VHRGGYNSKVITVHAEFSYSTYAVNVVRYDVYTLCWIHYSVYIQYTGTYRMLKIESPRCHPLQMTSASLPRRQDRTHYSSGYPSKDSVFLNFTPIKLSIRYLPTPSQPKPLHHGFCSSANYFGLTCHKESSKQYSNHFHLSKKLTNYALYSS
jgi:hypothetical protein